MRRTAITYRHVNVGARKSICYARCTVKYCTNAEISDLDLASVIYQQIRRFQVSMDYAFLVMKIP